MKSPLLSWSTIKTFTFTWISKLFTLIFLLFFFLLLECIYDYLSRVPFVSLVTEPFKGNANIHVSSSKPLFCPWIPPNSLPRVCELWKSGPILQSSVFFLVQAILKFWSESLRRLEQGKSYEIIFILSWWLRDIILKHVYKGVIINETWVGWHCNKEHYLFLWSIRRISLAVAE